MCCSTVQCWASLPGMQCCAVQCSAVLPGVLDCSPGCSTEQQSASLPGVQLRTAHRSPGCSASPLRVQRGTAQGRAAHPGVQGITPGVQLRAVQRFWSAAQDSAFLLGCSAACCSVEQCIAPRGAAQGRASLPGCSTPWGTVLLPGVQRGAGLWVPPSTPAVFLGAEGLPPRGAMEAPGGLPHTSQPRPAPLADACPAVRYLACKL